MHPNTAGGKVTKTMFLPEEHEGKPTAWIYEDKPGYFIARTNMSEWAIQELYQGYVSDLKYFKGKEKNTLISMTVNRVKYNYVVRDGKVWRQSEVLNTIDIASGSFAACEAAIRMYNI